MSIWGPGPFDNDDGADWFADLRDEPSLGAVRAAVEPLADPQFVGFIEMVDGAEAVAAAEVLAELLGAPGDEPVLGDEHEDLAEALKAELQALQPRERHRLVRQALDALDAVLNDRENSELRQLWEEQGDLLPEWSAAMAALQQRLQRFATG